MFLKSHSKLFLTIFRAQQTSWNLVLIFPCYFHLHVKSAMSTSIFPETMRRKTFSLCFHVGVYWRILIGFLALVSKHPRNLPRYIWWAVFSSFWRIYVFFPWYIYLEKVRLHAPHQFPTVKESFTKGKVSRVTAPNDSFYRFSPVIMANPSL